SDVRSTPLKRGSRFPRRYSAASVPALPTFLGVQGEWLTTSPPQAVPEIPRRLALGSPCASARRSLRRCTHPCSPSWHAHMTIAASHKPIPRLQQLLLQETRPDARDRSNS